MVVATRQLTGFVGEMARETVLAHYERLLTSGLGKEEAIAQTIDAIIHGGRSADFVRAFGATHLKGMISGGRSSVHPSGYTETPPLVPLPDRDGEGGQSLIDTPTTSASSPSPDPIPQSFPEPGAGRVLNMAKLRDARELRGLLAGEWSVDGKDVKMGLLTREQCFKLGERLTSLGKTNVANGKMFERLGRSLKSGEVVADRWDSERIHILFKVSEPNL